MPGHLKSAYLYRSNRNLIKEEYKPGTKLGEGRKLFTETSMLNIDRFSELDGKSEKEMKQMLIKGAQSASNLREIKKTVREIEKQKTITQPETEIRGIEKDAGLGEIIIETNGFRPQESSSVSLSELDGEPKMSPSHAKSFGTEIKIEVVK
jgi:hypothetical protein